MPVSEAQNPSAPDESVRILKLDGSYEGLGIVLDFLSRIEPFSKFDLGNFAKALRHQLARGDHLAAMSGNRLVGYCGWLPTTQSIGEAWEANKGPLRPIMDGTADAAALTVVASTDRKVITMLLRRAREDNGQLRVFFKRDYAGAAPSKKGSVRI
jgi:hypothetical protein